MVLLDFPANYPISFPTLDRSFSFIWNLFHHFKYNTMIFRWVEQANLFTFVIGLSIYVRIFNQKSTAPKLYFAKFLDFFNQFH